MESQTRTNTIFAGSCSHSINALPLNCSTSDKVAYSSYEKGHPDAKRIRLIDFTVELIYSTARRMNSEYYRLRIWCLWNVCVIDDWLNEDRSNVCNECHAKHSDSDRRLSVCVDGSRTFGIKTIDWTHELGLLTLKQKTSETLHFINVTIITIPTNMLCLNWISEKFVCDITISLCRL